MTSPPDAPPSTTPRIILHADMDAFFASVEQRDHPSLRGLPLVVGGPPPRGVVAAASYEARVHGVHSAMPMVQAQRRCPDLVVVGPRHDHYAAVSTQVFAIFSRFSPLVEPLSLDEAFLDLQGTARLHGPPEEVARQLKVAVRRELGLVVSVGIGPSKFVAKVASDLGKPDGLVRVPSGGQEAFLAPLPVSRLFGAGAVTQRKLTSLGIETIGQLARRPRERLVRELGTGGGTLWDLARGLDPRPIQVDRAPESMGHEDTFSNDISDINVLCSLVKEQADRVAARLRGEGYQARAVVLKVKTAGFKTRTRRRSLARATSDGGLMGRLACELLRKLQPGLGPLRLTGVSATRLEPASGQQQLCFEEPEEQQAEDLGQTLDRISARFGKGVLVRGSSLKADKDP